MLMLLTLATGVSFAYRLPRCGISMGVNSGESTTTRIASIKSAIASLEEAGVSALSLAPLRKELLSFERAAAAAAAADARKPAPAVSSPPVPQNRPPPTTDVLTTLFQWATNPLEAMERSMQEARARQLEADARRRAAAQAAQERAAAEDRLSPREKARLNLSRAVEGASIKSIKPLAEAVEAAAAAGLGEVALREARTLLTDLSLVAFLEAEEVKLQMALRRAQIGGRSEEMKLVHFVEDAASIGVAGEAMREACALLAKKKYSVDVKIEPAKAKAAAAAAAAVAQRDQVARAARSARAAASEVAAGATAAQAQAQAAAQAQGRAAAEQAAAEQAAAEQAAAAAAAAASPLRVADAELSSALQQAVAQVLGGGSQSTDALRLKSLRGAIESAAAAGVDAAKVGAARSKLAEMEVEAVARVKGAMLSQALRRAQVGGKADLFNLARAVNEATAAGMDGDLLKAARALLGKRGDSQQQEIARLQTRLEKFEKLAEQGEGGERDTAMAMAAKARADLERAGYSA